MRRRIALGVGVGLVVASLMLPASGEAADPPLPQYPCTQGGFTDIAGDAHPAYAAPYSDMVFASERQLDIRAVNLQLTADKLEVFMAIDGPVNASEMQEWEPAYRYEVTFNYGAKLFTYGIQEQNTLNPAQPTDGGLYPKMNMGTGPDDMKTQSTAVIRSGDGSAGKPTWIIFTSPRALIEKNLGGRIDPGTSFTNIVATTSVMSTPAKQFLADTLDTPAAKASYVVGNDGCFGPPATSIGSVTVAPAQWSDASKMSAVLLDAAAKPLAGKALTFSIGGTTITKTATTDSSGRATATYAPVQLHAGSYPVTVRFAGDSTAKASTATGTLNVSLESCAFKPLQVTKASGNRRIVTATLLDNDHHPVAGVSVDWLVNGKKTATAKTDKNGRVQLRSGKPGQKVQAKFAGAAGMLTGATSKTVKL